MASQLRWFQELWQRKSFRRHRFRNRNHRIAQIQTVCVFLRYVPVRKMTLTLISRFRSSHRDDSGSDSDRRDQSADLQDPDYPSKPDIVNDPDIPGISDNLFIPVIPETPPRRSRSRQRRSSSRHSRVLTHFRDKRETDIPHKSNRLLSLRVTDVRSPRKP